MRKGERKQSEEDMAASLWSSPAFHFTSLFLPFLFFFSSFPRPTISSPPSPFFVGSPAMERRRDDTAGKERPAPKREELPADDDDDDEEDTPTEDERRTKRPVGPSARKAGAGGAGGPACQVERCLADLSAAKRYHRRHKVCEHHAKAAAVVVAGLHQRFCQQCSRFHELSEFDETKRSCRRRLAGHNERRRKSSSETQGESSGRKGGGSQLKENHCRQGKISLPPGANLKDFQIR